LGAGRHPLPAPSGARANSIKNQSIKNMYCTKNYGIENPKTFNIFFLKPLLNMRQRFRTGDVAES
jgi:hypothetical protein